MWRAAARQQRQQRPTRGVTPRAGQRRSASLPHWRKHRGQSGDATRCARGAFGAGRLCGAAHPHIKLPHRPLGVEAMEHHLRSGDGNLRQLQHDTHLLDTFAAEDALAGDHALVVVRVHSVSSPAYVRGGRRVCAPSDYAALLLGRHALRGRRGPTRRMPSHFTAASTTCRAPPPGGTPARWPRGPRGS